MQNLTLFYFPSCPFCRKVLHYLDRNGISVPLKNIHEKRQYFDELVQTGGKSQVPCLVIDGRALYESDDIIDWFEKRGKVA